MSFPSLPPAFVLGAATAAYQIEGAVSTDGRGPSIWDTFARTPGRVHRGDTGDVACDHYHRFPEDIALLRELGVHSYRFSIAWPRIQPTGAGPMNPKGLDFYTRLIDTLLENGIEPAVTLYHWDLPQALEDRGGWRLRETAERFAEYAGHLGAALGDRVPRWITLNEPWCSAFLGYGDGHHAPGAAEGTPALAAAHHLLVGHGLALTALRAEGVREVGITLNLDHVIPATGSAEDAAAAVRAETQHNLIWTEPLLRARYPESEDETWAELIRQQTFRREGDLAVISAPMDFLGINYYTPAVVRAAAYREPEPARRTAMDNAFTGEPLPGARRTEMGWSVAPDTLEELLVSLRRRYGTDLPPVFITENGSAEADTQSADGRVHDTDRIAYLSGHTHAVARAVEAGVNVRGYYVWSLLDNFEWAYGYSKRFGIIHVDYATQHRTPKSSFHWYKGLIAAQKASPARAGDTGSPTEASAFATRTPATGEEG